jgi:hypothetical protein
MNLMGCQDCIMFNRNAENDGESPAPESGGYARRRASLKRMNKRDIGLARM